MNIAQLETKLPTQTIVWRGFGSPMMIDLNALTGDAVTPESVFFESLAKLMEATYQLQLDVNTERESQNKSAIELVDRKVEVSGNGNPIYIYTLNVEVDTSAALNNLMNPVGDDQ